MGEALTSCAVLKPRVHSLAPMQLPGGKVAIVFPSLGDRDRRIPGLAAQQPSQSVSF